MKLFLAAVALIVAGGAVSALAGRRRRFSTLAAVAAITAGSACGVVAAVRVLAGWPTARIKLPWQVPFGSVSLAVDPLSALFLLALFLLAPAAAVYGGRYLEHEHPGRPQGAAWALTSLLIAAMAVVFAAGNGVLFLVAWELMSLAAYFLVTLEHRRTEVREAGWTYLVATHLGTMFLVAFFVLLGRGGGSLDFRGLDLESASPAFAGLLFVLAVIGFGTKAGLVPFHVWLPEAHPAAPSHVSALMSGVMIATGVYGIVRALLLLPAPAPWWGWLLLALGLLSGVGGVLFALAQHDLKRLLAYSSIENVGLIALALGLGVLGATAGRPLVAVAGFAGALLHVLNHALVKGLLFLGAGAVAQAAGTRDLNRLGGLVKRMPWTAGSCAVGAAAIAGLPPFGGFISELLLAIAACAAAIGGGGGLLAAAVLGVTALGLIAGLGLACFSKAFGATFLGEARGRAAGAAGEVAVAMRLPMVALAVACAVTGIAAPWVVAGIGSAVAQVAAKLGVTAPRAELARLGDALSWVALACLATVAAVAVAALARRLLLRGRVLGEEATWGCGYLAPTTRMQYTGSSFAQPLVDGFRPLLRTTVLPPDATLQGLYPAPASFATATPDLAEHRLYRPAFRWATAQLGRLRWLQQGRVQLYLLYVVVTLVVLLLWKVR